jgi:hypothetical protein
MFKKTRHSLLGLFQSAMAADLFTVTTVDGATTSQVLAPRGEFNSIKLDAMRACFPHHKQRRRSCLVPRLGHESGLSRQFHHADLNTPSTA